MDNIIYNGWHLFSKFKILYIYNIVMAIFNEIFQYLK